MAKLNVDGNVLPQSFAMTVESTRPVFKKIKRMTIEPMDPRNDAKMRKLLRSLQSGLLAETTWALDTILITSYSGGFRLGKHRGILTHLLDYYKFSLSNLFEGLFDDEPLNKGDQALSNDTVNDKTTNGEVVFKENDKTVLLSGCDNFTFMTRAGVPVKVSPASKPVCLDRLLKSYDNDDEDSANGQAIARNDFDSFDSTYIIEGLDPKDELTRFVRSEQPSLVAEKQTDKAVNGLKRKKVQYENESEKYDLDTVLCPRRENVENLIKRCQCLSSIFRNLSFQSDNAIIMSANSSLMFLLSRLLLFGHQHVAKKNFATVLAEIENKTLEKEKAEASKIFDDQLFDILHSVRINSLVTLSNVSEYLDLSKYSDKIILPLLDALLHWVVCSSTYSKDPHPPDNVPIQVLVLDILSKLCINVANIDLLLATPPFNRIEQFLQILIELIGKDKDQTSRELSLVIMANISAADVLSCRILLHTSNAVNNLLNFIEQHEMITCHQICNRSHPAAPFPEPFTIPYMLRNAANTLKVMATVCDVTELGRLKKYESKFIDLTISHYLHPEILAIMADLVYVLSHREAQASSAGKGASKK